MFVVESESGKKISIYDNVFEYHQRVAMYAFIKNSFYKSNGADAGESDQFFCRFSKEDLDNIGICKTLGYKSIERDHSLLDREIKQVRVNLSHPLEKNVPHCDGEGVTLIYYANDEWDTTWGGHTLFLSEDLKESVYLSLYKPNRVVVFDSSIPHMIINPTVAAKAHRHSFVIQYKK